MLIPYDKMKKKRTISLDDKMFLVLGTKQKEKQTSKTVIGPPYKFYATEEEWHPPFYNVIYDPKKELILERLNPSSHAYQKVRKYANKKLKHNFSEAVKTKDEVLDLIVQR